MVHGEQGADSMFDMVRVGRRGVPEAEVEDEIPADWLAAFERESGSGESGSRLRGLHRSIVIGAVVFDLILLACAYAISGAISGEDVGNLASSGADTSAATNMQQAREMMVLGTVIGVVLLVSAAVGIVLRMPGLALVQGTLLVISCLVAFGVAQEYYSQPPAAPGTSVQPTTTPGQFGYCSGGRCYGTANQGG